MDNKACKEEVISFNCSANANPGVTENKGVFVFKCVAKNSLGSEYSTSVTVAVNGKQNSPIGETFINVRTQL